MSSDTKADESSGRTGGGVAVSFPEVPFSDEWSEAFRRQVEDAKIAGWTIDEAYRNRVVMVNRDYGTLATHTLIAVLTAWWTLGLGNAAYAAYRYFSEADRKVLRDEDTEQ